ncbi:MAG: hypothetical protein PHU85_07990, partial [Phycisphaerae bacterium]|nr:hypothetical protein [Phycisphaerae bacterium]
RCRQHQNNPGNFPFVPTGSLEILQSSCQLGTTNGMNPVETYLGQLQDICSTGAVAPKVGYYGGLANLLDDIGETTRPKDHCVINLKQAGADIPDGGRILPDQLQKARSAPLSDQLPARWAIADTGVTLADGLISPREDRCCLRGFGSSDRSKTRQRQSWWLRGGDTQHV